MKHIQVACALIEHRGKVLAAQRSRNMSLPLKWEFPGGKIKDGETPEECLRREVNEELNIGIKIVRPLSPATHHYQVFSVTLHPFICTIISGEITLREHAAIVWLALKDLSTLEWADADWPVIEEYRKIASMRPHQDYS